MESSNLPSYFNDLFLFCVKKKICNENNLVFIIRCLCLILAHERRRSEKIMEKFSKILIQLKEYTQSDNLQCNYEA